MILSVGDKLFIPIVQKALVLQGGGVPGAYQAGAFKAPI
jgi:predicted acylesterase/phospholipase RssA